MQNHINNPRGKTPKGEGKYKMVPWNGQKDVQLIKWLEEKGINYISANRWKTIADQFEAEVGYEVSVSTVTTKSRLLFPNLKAKRASKQASEPVQTSKPPLDARILELGMITATIKNCAELTGQKLIADLCRKQLEIIDEYGYPTEF